jgi:hypothetical protein
MSLPWQYETAISKAAERPKHLQQAYLLPALFLLIHVPLAFLMRQNSMIALGHYFLTLTIGLIIVLHRHGTERVMYVAAYIAGSEVLWRMAKLGLFWEIGKYTVVCLFMLSIYRSHRIQFQMLPILYFVLLLPSAMPVFVEEGFTGARKGLSANLSGPLSLMTCVWFFSRLKVSRDELDRLMLYMLGPMVSISMFALFGIASADKITFDTESNYQTSGGFGPNQVSSILGLGMVIAFFSALNEKVPTPWRALMIGLAVLFLAQSALTFSRSGLYNGLGSLFIAFIFLIRDPRKRLEFMFSMVIALILTAWLVYPMLNDFTGGKLEERFTETQTSNRADIAAADLELFSQHLLFGVGPGQAKHERDFRVASAAHTEFSRMLGEHGVFGLASLLLLLAMGMIAVWKAPPPFSRAVASAFVCFALLYMTHAAMRTLIPGFTFGLAFLALREAASSNTMSGNSPAQETESY